MTLEILAEEAVRVLSTCVRELRDAGRLSPGSMILLGCSTSEISGGRIGKASVPEFGEAVARAFLSACSAFSFQPAFQCCEHLNRAVVLPRTALQGRQLTQVCAIPQPHAGGSVAAAAWKLLEEPVLCQSVQADAALDVGDTLVGMHIRPVAVPLRGSYSSLGNAHLVMAYSRLPLIGGARAVYPDKGP